jgi:hypothetical protein
VRLHHLLKPMWAHRLCLLVKLPLTQLRKQSWKHRLRHLVQRLLKHTACKAASLVGGQGVVRKLPAGTQCHIGTCTAAAGCRQHQAAVCQQVAWLSSNALFQWVDGLLAGALAAHGCVSVLTIHHAQLLVLCAALTATAACVPQIKD